MSEWKLTNMEAVQLMKDYTKEGARGAMEFYLNTNSIFVATFNDLRKWKISLPMSFRF